MSTRNFPLARPAKDPRFTFGLAVAVAEVLTDRGYPVLTGSDFVELQESLFKFLYRDSLDGTAPAGREIPVGDVIAGDRLWLDDGYQEVTSAPVHLADRLMVYTEQNPDGVRFDDASSPVRIVRREVDGPQTT
jgi:hypothetical protein